ncbi:MAG: hypothetical protein M3N30_05775 [Bacteroidota bacterium]|nr:hypothetical protein [Bacteroidota bacterium]
MKKLLFSAAALCLSSIAFSQTFRQGIGINVVLQSASGFKADPVGGIMWSPSLHFMETDNSSLSVGIPMSFGISGSYNSQYAQSNSLSFMFDAPLIFNYNYGAGSTKEAEDKFGFFAGAGVGYHINQYTATDDFGYSNSAKMAGFGPVGNVGARLGVGRGSHNLELRFSYMKTLDITKSNVIGIGFLFNF